MGEYDQRAMLTLSHSMNNLASNISSQWEQQQRLLEVLDRLTYEIARLMEKSTGVNNVDRHET